LKIELDASAFRGELRTLVELANEFPEVSDLALQVLDHPAKFCNVRNVLTVGASVCVVVFEPGDFLMGLVSALRARKGEKFIIKIASAHSATNATGQPPPHQANE
jgi:hypothetical protein